LTPSGSTYSYNVIHSFEGAPNDASNPQGGLLLTSRGVLIGTAAGGANSYGAVFALFPSGSTYAESVLYNFKRTKDLAFPRAGVASDTEGILYGTAFEGGTKGYGGVFNLRPLGKGYKETVLYNFKFGKDGAFPDTGVAIDANGNLLGVSGGGKPGYGIVFELSPPVTGRGYKETILLTFKNSTTGEAPLGGVILAPGGGLDGTTAAGGHSDDGLVFQLTY
jgi:hypothetical protein